MVNLSIVSFIQRVTLFIFIFLVGYKWRFIIWGSDILIVGISSILMHVHIIDPLTWSRSYRASLKLHPYVVKILTFFSYIFGWNIFRILNYGFWDFIEDWKPLK